MEVQLIKQPGGLLRPANQADADAMAKIGNGKLLHVELRQPRNPLFHRRFFAMLNFAYDYWEPEAEELNGMMPAKNFERFRKDVMILAGFRTLVVNVRNEVRYEAESISFASMDDTRFSEVYRCVFNVLWGLVLGKAPNMTPEIAENTINSMLSYD